MEGLPPGFRFFPTDEELITCYLARKAADTSFTSAAIRDVDLYSFDPWDLPCIPHNSGQQLQAAGGGDLHQQDCCYFFCTKGSRYSSGVRARRATGSGYWKSTGKDKAVYCSAGGRLVGTKKTLVFYGGRAPSGKKTGWVMHEYALGESALLRGAQSEWVICRVLMKKDPSSDGRTTETETVHGGCDGKQDAAPPAYLYHTDSQCGADADGDKDPHHSKEMAQDEELLMTNNSSGSSCTSPPPLLIHDDQLGTNCSALQFMQMQPDDTDYYLPELLEYDDVGYHGLLNGSGAAQDTGDEMMDRRVETSAASVDSIRLLGGLHVNFGF